MINEVWFWIYVSVLGFFAGVIGVFHRGEHQKKETLKGKAFLLWFGGITGVFVAYVTGEFAFFITENQRISIAVSAATAWMGAKVLLEFQDRLLEFIRNYKKEEKR